MKYLVWTKWYFVSLPLSMYFAFISQYLVFLSQRCPLLQQYVETFRHYWDINELEYDLIKNIGNSQVINEPLHDKMTCVPSEDSESSLSA